MAKPGGAMVALGFLCPMVSNGNAFSRCTEDIFLGFGWNVATMFAILFSAATQNREACHRFFYKAKWLSIVPVLAMLLPTFCITTMVIFVQHGGNVFYSQWLYVCSEILLWVLILFVINYWSCHILIKHWILCIWWLLWPLLSLPQLWTTCLPYKDHRCFRFLLSFSVEVVFSTALLFIHIQNSSILTQRNSSFLHQPLVSHNAEEASNVYVLGARISNFWNYLSFRWVSPMMDTGLQKQLNFSDLFHLPEELDPCNCHYALSCCWFNEQRKHTSKPSLFRVIYNAYGCSFLWIGILKIINDGLGFSGPLILNSLIHFLQEGSKSKDGYIFAFGLGFLSVVRSFLGSQYTFLLSKLRLQLRASITTSIYQKCLRVNVAERSAFSTGEIQTFMSVDAERVVNLYASFHDLWSLPLQMGITLFLLYNQVKFAFLAGLIFIILLIPVNRWIAGKISLANQLMMKLKDERIRRVGELLMDIRTLKMYCWEHFFADRLSAVRGHEVEHLSTIKYLDAWCVYFWATTPSLISLLTFATYVMMGHNLDAATVFTSLTLFNMLISPLNSFPWVINGLVEAFISLRRLERFLSCVEINSDSSLVDVNEAACGDLCSSETPIMSRENDPAMAIVIHNSDSVWCSSEQDCQQLVLSGICLSIPKGLLTIIHGEVGAGKTSLLCTILGEMRMVKGTCFHRGSIAYVPQDPWILSGSLRENILFGKDYNEDRYAQVIAACALDADIACMKGGDHAIVGERGFNLSGGQRTRVALARALYQDCDIYLLDDILSAVDAHVSKWILNNAILGPLMNNKTRVFCTHNLQADDNADVVLLMERGSIKWVEASPDFQSSDTRRSHRMSGLFGSPSSQSLKNSVDAEIESVVSVLGNSNISCSDNNIDIVEDETRKEGTVECQVYRNYAVNMGWVIATTILLSTFLMQLTRNGNDLWLSNWVDATSKAFHSADQTKFLIIFTAIAVFNSLFTFGRAFSFAFGGLQAAIHIHNSLLRNIIEAPISFFDRNPRGRLLNRFSSDQYAIDDSLPFILNILLANIFSLSGIIMILCFVQWAFIILLLPLGYIYKRLQVYYRATSRELRRLDSVSRSPIYSSFTESLDGAATIRAFSRQDMFIGKNFQHVTRNQQASYSEIAASVWLSLRLQLLAASIIFFISGMAVFGQQSALPFISSTAGSAGLALSYAMPVVSLLNDLLTGSTETEKEMISVERVQEYMKATPEECESHEQVDPNWPLEGLIEFNNVILQYMPFLPPALRNVSFSINSGEKVGIAGRTGAGKSSVLNALFGLTPISGGSILIDKLNISLVSLKELRSRLCIVPQTPFLFQGTLRKNLDPFDKFPDFLIWEILEKCCMKDAVCGVGGLDSLIKEGGVPFSHGQRQLLCLARALLKSSKILCLDECTANVDPNTTTLIKETIARECRGITVVTIAHRISTIYDMDRVLIFDQGTIVEEGDPRELLQSDISKFSSLAKASCL